MYIYVSFNIERDFYYLGDSGNYIYIYIYNMYLSILKEAFNLKNFSKIERELLLKEAII